MPCNEMSADWAAQRIKGLSLWGAVVDGLKRSLGLNKRPNDGQAVKTLLETFRYPRLGPGMMWEAARDTDRSERGGTVAMGHALEQLASDGRGRLADDARPARRRSWSSRRRTRSARRRCASSPRGSIRCPTARSRQAELKYRDFLTVALMIKSDDLFPDNWIYIHDSKVQVGRVQNFRSWSPEMVPDAERRLRRPRILLLRRRRPVVVVRRRAGRTGDDAKWPSLACCDPADVIGGAVVRQEKAYPVYDEDYAANVAAMRARARGQASHAAPRRPQRHAPLQQPGPCDDDRDADGREHSRRPAAVRHLVRQRGRRVPRGRRRRRREGPARARDPRAPPTRPPRWRRSAKCPNASPAAAVARPDESHDRAAPPNPRHSTRAVHRGQRRRARRRHGDVPGAA